MEILLILLVILMLVNVAVTIAIAGTLAHLIQTPVENKENPASGLLDLPERQVSYRDVQLMENWDGISPRPENFDGMTYKK